LIDVSIIVPVYNKKNYLSRCIESLINQTKKEIQIILVDDGSTDGSYNLLVQYASKDNRIQVVKKQNGGLSSARNWGVRFAKGKYVGFVDADDWVEPDMYELLFEKATLDDIDIIMCSYFFEYEDRTIIDKRLENFMIDIVLDNDINKKTVVPNILEMKIDTGVCLRMYKREFMEKNKLYFNESLKMSEDYPFNIYAHIKASKTMFLNIPLYHYDQTDVKSMTYTLREDSIFQTLELYKLIYNIILKELKQPIKELDNWLYTFMRHLINLCVKDKTKTLKEKKQYISQISSKKEFGYIVKKRIKSNINRLKSRKFSISVFKELVLLLMIKFRLNYLLVAILSARYVEN